jgi:hypothetical protein
MSRVEEFLISVGKREKEKNKIKKNLIKSTSPDTESKLLKTIIKETYHDGAGSPVDGEDRKKAN